MTAQKRRKMRHLSRGGYQGTVKNIVMHLQFKNILLRSAQIRHPWLSCASNAPRVHLTVKGYFFIECIYDVF